jgi:transcriptional antiterminator NusG
MSENEKQWYVVHTYSGHEEKVRQALEQRMKSLDVEGRITQVIVPKVSEVEVKNGQRRQVKRKILPGYILVQMNLDEKTWSVVRNTSGVTGFVGSGSKPTPLNEEEVERIMRQMSEEGAKVRVGFKVGQSVRVIDGPFIDFMGTVREIDEDKGKVTVLLSLFGRETPVELDLLQVEKL